MICVPSYDEFSALARRIDDQAQQIEFLKSLLTTQMWLSRESTARALGVSLSTLWRLTRQGRLAYRYQGKKLQYDIEGLRAYLLTQRIEVKQVDQRLLSARLPR